MIKLSGIEVSPIDHVYLDNVDGGAISSTVYVMENKASKYNVREHPYFSSNPDKVYHVSFVQKNGRINATYNQDGKVESAFEKYLDLTPPPAVRNSAYRALPDWTMNSTTYTVNYDGKDAKKMYKVQLSKDKQKKTLKFDVDGRRID
jgi:hypothetical protein